MKKALATIFWKRLHGAGHDACRLLSLSDGFRLEGAAVFDHEGVPCSLTYVVDCDDVWRSRRANLAGFLGDATLVIDIERRATGGWFLNGEKQGKADGCIDLDLGFTPSTNLLFLRRAKLSIGEEAPAPAAYLAFPSEKLDRLEQSYKRVGEAVYAYAAPTFDYAAELKVSSEGFVTSYPGLWEAVFAQ